MVDFPLPIIPTSTMRQGGASAVTGALWRTLRSEAARHRARTRAAAARGDPPRRQPGRRRPVR